MKQANGYYYEGDFLEGKYNGKGILRFPDGGYYDGDFVDDKYHGRGKLHFP